MIIGIFRFDLAVHFFFAHTQLHQAKKARKEPQVPSFTKNSIIYDEDPLRIPAARGLAPGAAGASDSGASTSAASRTTSSSDDSGLPQMPASVAMLPQATRDDIFRMVSQAAVSGTFNAEHDIVGKFKLNNDELREILEWVFPSSPSPSRLTPLFSTPTSRAGNEKDAEIERIGALSHEELRAAAEQHDFSFATRPADAPHPLSPAHVVGICDRLLGLWEKRASAPAPLTESQRKRKLAKISEIEVAIKKTG